MTTIRPTTPRVRTTARAATRHVAGIVALVMTATLVLTGAPADAIGREHAAVAGKRPKPIVVAKPGTIQLARSTTGTVQVGAAVAFTGTAPKQLRGKQVLLQRRDRSKGPWITVARARVQSTGTFAVAGKAGQVGTNSWQATATLVKKPKKRTKATKRYVFGSPTVNTAVYGWFFLTDVADAVDDDDRGGSYPGAGNLTIGGTSYPRSIYFGSLTSSWDWEFPSWAEYNLSYRCLQMRASLGISVASETGTNATFFVSLDGARSAVGTQGLGPATPITVDVTNVLRVRFEGVPNSRNLYGFGGFGDVQVLCNAAP